VHAGLREPRARPWGTQGLEGSREFCGQRDAIVTQVGWVKSFIVAEGDMVVQFGTRELIWPGGAFSATRHQREPQSATWPLPAGWSMAALAIRDDLTMLRQLGALQP
jgi:hypothetical protein